MENKKKNIFLRILFWLRDYFRVIKMGIKSIGEDNVTMLSSGMVYSMLIALVPCITFLGAFLSAFGAFGSFFEALKDTLIYAIGEEAGEFLISTIGNFSQNAMSLGIVGLVSYLITGIFLVNKVYNVMNNIFRTKPKGKFVTRLFSFLVFLIVFTVLLVFAFGLSTRFKDLLYSVFGLESEKSSSVSRLLQDVSSFIGIFLVLFILLKFVPSTKIRNGAALSGAILGGIVISIISHLFSYFIKFMVNVSVIYGSLSSLFFILLYLYVLWYIILGIAEITYIYQFRPNRNIHISHPITSENEIGEAISLMMNVAKCYNSGNGAISTRELSVKMNIPTSRLYVYTGDLKNAGLLIPTNTQGTSFVIGKPADQIYTSEIIEAIFSPFSLEGEESIGDKVSVLFKESGLEKIRTLSLEDLLIEEKKNDSKP